MALPHIKRFQQFLENKKMEVKEDKEEKNNDYNCVMLYVDINIWDDIINTISDEDKEKSSKIEYGLHKNEDTHVTLLYGIHKDVPRSEVESIIKDIDVYKFSININKLHVFECEDYDVLVIKVDDEYCSELNLKFRGLPHTNEYPDYQAHITIGYFEKGSASKYLDIINLDDITLTPYKVVYDDNNELFTYMEKEFRDIIDEEE